MPTRFSSAALISCSTRPVSVSGTHGTGAGPPDQVWPGRRSRRVAGPESGPAATIEGSEPAQGLSPLSRANLYAPDRLPGRPPWPIRNRGQSVSRLRPRKSRQTRESSSMSSRGRACHRAGCGFVSTIGGAPIPVVPGAFFPEGHHFRWINGCRPVLFVGGRGVPPASRFSGWFKLMVFVFELGDRTSRSFFFERSFSRSASSFELAFGSVAFSTTWPQAAGQVAARWSP